MSKPPTPPGMRELVEWCREQRAQALSSIARCEAGELKVGRISNGQLMDETADHLASLRRTVEASENIIAAYERDYG